MEEERIDQEWERNDQKEGNKQEKDLTEKREAAEEPVGKVTKGWLRWSTGAPAVPLLQFHYFSHSHCLYLKVQVGYHPQNCPLTRQELLLITHQ